MKKLTILLLAFGFWLLAMPGNALAATLSLDPSTGTFNKGCSFSINIVLDTQNTRTDGTDAILFYDNSRLSINTSGILPNNAIYPDFPGNNVDEAGGKITISGLASPTTPFSGKGNLATLQFSVKPDAPTGATQIKFDFTTGSTTDSNVVEQTTIADALASVVNGNYTVGSGSCTNVSPTPVQAGGAGSKGGQGGGQVATGSGQKKVPPTLDTIAGKGGTPELTAALGIIGGILTVLGILGLALL